VTWVNNKILAAIAFFFILSSLTYGMNRSLFLKEVNNKLFQHIKLMRPSADMKDLEISITNLPDLEEYIIKTTSFNLRIADNSNLIGKTVIFIDFFDENFKIIKKNKMITSIIMYENFLKTTKLIDKDEKITSSNVIVVYENNYGKPVQNFHSISQLENYRTLSKIGTGVYLARFMVKEDPTIKRNDKITLKIKKGVLEIEILGQALEDGYKGKSIRVKSLLEEEKTFEGEVLDNETVLINSIR